MADQFIRQLTDQQNWESRIFPLKYIDANDLRTALSMFRAEIGPRSNLGVVSVRAPKEIMPAIADAIKQLDVAVDRKNVELTVYVLSAGPDQDVSRPIPQSLEAVVNQLKNVFSYKGFELLDTIVIRGSDGQATQTQGALPLLPDALAQSFYTFRTQLSVRISDGKDPSVRLNEMRFNVRVPIRQALTGPSFSYTDASIDTDLEVPRGQQVVVGKTTVGDRAMILVINAKVVD